MDEAIVPGKGIVVWARFNGIWPALVLRRTVYSSSHAWRVRFFGKHPKCPDNEIDLTSSAFECFTTNMIRYKYNSNGVAVAAAIRHIISDAANTYQRDLFKRTCAKKSRPTTSSIVKKNLATAKRPRKPFKYSSRIPSPPFITSYRSITTVPPHQNGNAVPVSGHNSPSPSARNTSQPVQNSPQSSPTAQNCSQSSAFPANSTQPTDAAKDMSQPAATPRNSVQSTATVRDSTEPSAIARNSEQPTATVKNSAQSAASAGNTRQLLRTESSSGNGSTKPSYLCKFEEALNEARQELERAKKKVKLLEMGLYVSNEELDTIFVGKNVMGFHRCDAMLAIAHRRVQQENKAISSNSDFAPDVTTPPIESAVKSLNNAAKESAVKLPNDAAKEYAVKLPNDAAKEYAVKLPNDAAKDSAVKSSNNAAAATVSAAVEVRNNTDSRSTGRSNSNLFPSVRRRKMLPTPSWKLRSQTRRSVPTDCIEEVVIDGGNADDFHNRKMTDLPTASRNPQLSASRIQSGSRESANDKPSTAASNTKLLVMESGVGTPDKPKTNRPLVPLSNIVAPKLKPMEVSDGSIIEESVSNGNIETTKVGLEAVPEKIRAQVLSYVNAMNLASDCDKVNNIAKDQKPVPEGETQDESGTNTKSMNLGNPVASTDQKSAMIVGMEVEQSNSKVEKASESVVLNGEQAKSTKVGGEAAREKSVAQISSDVNAMNLTCDGDEVNNIAKDERPVPEGEAQYESGTNTKSVNMENPIAATDQKSAMIVDMEVEQSNSDVEKISESVALNGEQAKSRKVCGEAVPEKSVAQISSDVNAMNLTCDGDEVNNVAKDQKQVPESEAQEESGMNTKSVNVETMVAATDQKSAMIVGMEVEQSNSKVEKESVALNGEQAKSTDGDVSAVVVKMEKPAGAPEEMEVLGKWVRKKLLTEGIDKEVHKALKGKMVPIPLDLRKANRSEMLTMRKKRKSKLKKKGRTGYETGITGNVKVMAHCRKMQSGTEVEKIVSAKPVSVLKSSQTTAATAEST